MSCTDQKSSNNNSAEKPTESYGHAVCLTYIFQKVTFELHSAVCNARNAPKNSKFEIILVLGFPLFSLKFIPFGLLFPVSGEGLGRLESPQLCFTTQEARASLHK